ncbi:hypothetical protein OG320_06915 [Microbispora sp. NBC_01189]|uniref:hypothetical protein n=1 Tax=Microbispora sp. NBC_01189 TaxID=2903583 RepID=UPI002E165F48|nr:hypothetical protein OG320_06915 [Microbispora sp. NBC_01189]
MRSLSCVLVREGPSDDWFLPILLRRALEELVIENFPACREVQEVRPLPEAGNQHPETVIKASELERGTADRTALVRALNLRRLDREPVSGSGVEACPDPKAVIATLLRDEAGMNPKKKGVLRNFYVSVAETAGIGELRKVPAFRQWWDDMIEALEGLGYQHG